jgi:hypothetical protein
MSASATTGLVVEGYPGVEAWLAAHDPAAAAMLLSVADTVPTSPPTDAQGGGPLLPSARLVPVDQAVPAGRLGYRLDDDVLLCHTLIAADGYEQLRRTGRVGPDPAHVRASDVSGPEFASAYDWMRWQMYQRVPGYSGRYPVWVWARIRRYDLLSSVRHAARASSGEVLLTLRIPRERVLLTDFDAWHYVLNGGASPPLTCPGCGTVQCDDLDCVDSWFDNWWDGWDRRIPRTGDGQRAPWWTWPPVLRAELFDSWQALFTPPRRLAVQGCVELIETEWVRDAVIPRFTGRVTA